LSYSVNLQASLGSIPPGGAQIAKVFAYTSTWFLCQNSDGSCPVDFESQAAGLAIPSPIADVFEGVCPTDENGFFRVCVYACVQAKQVVW
ncbi:MAG: hypothetical protein AAGJ35_11620, partial [Myxococcota bacterium]